MWPRLELRCIRCSPSIQKGVVAHVSYTVFWVFFPSTPTPLQVHSLKLALEGVEKERDFYFGKLREIELLCQEHGQENDDLVQRLMEVLYASEEHVSVRRALDCCVLKRCRWSGHSEQWAFRCPGISENEDSVHWSFPEE